ncbi:MAG: hypothetical protein RIC14_09940 [Filomicrobium sp.]
MTFDSRTKELAKAHDAVDRLREAQSHLQQRSDLTTDIADRTIRFVLFTAVACLVAYAFWML